MTSDRTDVNQLKKTLRSQVLQQVKQLSSDYLHTSNQSIFQQLMTLEQVKCANTIFCYISTDREIDTRSLIQSLLDQGKTVCVPKCHDSLNMDAYQILSLDDLVMGKYGIPTAQDHCRLVQPDEINIGIIPGVSVDLAGNRLGYGNGFYDIYFARSHFTKIMLCRKILMVDHIPMQEWDQPIDILVTEQDIIDFTAKI